MSSTPEETLKKLLTNGLITQAEFDYFMGYIAQDRHVNMSESEVNGFINTGETNVGGGFSSRDMHKTTLQENKENSGGLNNNIGRDAYFNDSSLIGEQHNYYYSSAEEVLKTYYLMILQKYGFLALWELSNQENNVSNKEKVISLPNIYVDLDTANTVWENDNLRPLTALEALQLESKLMLLGDPGTGKSTFVAHLAYCLSAHALYPTEQWLERLPGWKLNQRTFTPLLVTLSDFAKFEPNAKLDSKAPERLWLFIEYQLEKQQMKFVVKDLKKKLGTGELLILLDGLDEVSIDQRQILKKIIEQFIQLHKGNYFVVTSRILSYQTSNKREELLIKNLPIYTLSPLNKIKTEQFIQAWYAELNQRQIIAENPKEKTRTLLFRLDHQMDIKGIQKLTSNPLLLTALVSIDTCKGELPTNLVLLYEEYVKALLQRWKQIKSENILIMQESLEKTGLEQIVWELAYKAHSEEIELEREVATFTYFFQEYLAGAYISNQLQFVELAYQLVHTNWKLWREVIKLAVGRMVYVADLLDNSLLLVDKLLYEVIEPSYPAKTTYWHKVWLAGELLIEIGVQRIKEHNNGKERLEEARKKLTELIITGQLEPNERLMAGEVLGLIGDKRPGVGVVKVGEIEVPDIEFCYIPPGPFYMSSGEEDVYAQEHEKPRHRLDITYGYWLSKYLVTVKQYLTFVHDKSRHTISRSSFYEQQASLYGSSSPTGLPNQPVNEIIISDVLEFCIWLTKISQTQGWLPHGYQITLPNEAEWEKGARGGLKIPYPILPSQKLSDGLSEPEYTLAKENPEPMRLYPWGNKFDIDCALTKEGGFNRKGVVGVFPKGQTVYGLCDMSGNVIEWTTSNNEEFFLFKTETLRGGSYGRDAEYSRIGFRQRIKQRARGAQGGFRLCVSKSNTE